MGFSDTADGDAPLLAPWSRAVLLSILALATTSCAGSRCPAEAARGPDGECWEQSDFGPDEGWRDDEAPED